MIKDTDKQTGNLCTGNQTKNNIRPHLTALVLGAGLDALAGDPPMIFHPVKSIGAAITGLESILRPFVKSPRAELLAGAAMTAMVSGGAWWTAHLVLRQARQIHPVAGIFFSGYIMYTMIAMKDLADHVDRVKQALDNNDLPDARKQVAMLVSRDTENLSEEKVVSAALESLFENTADGVAAPMFYGALGGPRLAVFYKAVNTLDSMVGYKNERYLYFGRAAALLDDMVNYFPARLTGLLMIKGGFLQGRDWRQGWRAMLADRYKHDSPNSAWPEAAAAGVLGVRLGGPAYYDGKPVGRPYLNEKGRPPRPGDLKRGLSLFRTVALLAVTGAAALTVLAGSAGNSGSYN